MFYSFSLITAKQSFFLNLSIAASVFKRGVTSFASIFGTAAFDF